VAQALYQETPESVAKREKDAEQRRLAARTVAGHRTRSPDQARPAQIGRLEPLERVSRPE
jgi:hypothetical protein